VVGEEALGREGLGKQSVDIKEGSSSNHSKEAINRRKESNYPSQKKRGRGNSGKGERRVQIRSPTKRKGFKKKKKERSSSNRLTRKEAKLEEKGNRQKVLVEKKGVSDSL